MKKYPLLIIAGLFAFVSQAAHASFDGDFSIEPATTYSSGVGTFGNWTYSIVVFTGVGSIETSVATDSLVLNAYAFGMLMSDQTTVTLTCAPVDFDGTISFTASSLSGLSVTANSVNVASSGFDYSFDLSYGQSFTISLSAISVGSFDPVLLLPMPGVPVSYSTTISNFSAISAVPEPSTYALGAGVVVLGIAGAKRRRSRKA